MCYCHFLPLATASFSFLIAPQHNIAYHSDSQTSTWELEPLCLCSGRAKEAINPQDYAADGGRRGFSTYLSQCGPQEEGAWEAPQMQMQVSQASECVKRGVLEPTSCFDLETRSEFLQLFLHILRLEELCGGIWRAPCTLSAGSVKLKKAPVCPHSSPSLKSASLPGGSWPNSLESTGLSYLSIYVITLSRGNENNWK